MKYRHAGEEKGVTSGCTLTPWPCQRRQGRGPALGPKRRRGNKDATPPGPIQSGTASENSNPEAAGEGRTGWTTSLGTAVVGGGGRRHTQTLDPANPACRAQLPANRSTTASSLCSGRGGPGPGPAPQSVGVRGTPIRNEQRGTEWGDGREARTEHRREGGARPPASHPLKESTAPRGGVGAERKTGLQQSCRACSGGRPASSAQGRPSALTGTHTTQSPRPSFAQDWFTKRRA